MISKVSIRNFKCLRDVQIDLERFTVFVGPNAAGKSSILQALDWLCRSFNKDENLEGELTKAISRGATESVELAGESGSNWYRYRTHSSATPSKRRPNAGWSGEGRAVATDIGLGDWKPWKPGPNGVAPCPRSVLLRLEVSTLTKVNPAADPTIMASDGTGLHSALASMALHEPDAWQRLQTDLRRIIPTVRRLRHTKGAPTALLFDTVGADSLPATQVSEGTLLVLGLLAALHASDRPSLMLLDDLDRGLHPKAQRELIALLRGLLETNPDLQILATTHSPYLLDWMEPKEVRMTQLDDEGGTVCASLTSHPQFNKWKAEFYPGEMWSMFGEKWVVEEQEVAS